MESDRRSNNEHPSILILISSKIFNVWQMAAQWFSANMIALQQILSNSEKVRNKLNLNSP